MRSIRQHVRCAAVLKDGQNEMRSIPRSSAEALRLTPFSFHVLLPILHFVLPGRGELASSEESRSIQK